MANGAIGGGIGAGILTGLQFMRQRDADARADQALQMQGQRLQMDQDMHGAKMGELNRANDERNRLEMYNALQTQVESVYGTGADALPEYDRKKMVIDKALGAGIIKPAELELAKKSYDSAVQLAGVDAFDAATKRGDLTPLNKILASKELGSAAAGSDGTITITGANGQAQQFKPSDLLNLQIMAGAYDREAARAKAVLDARKKEADITRVIADAGRLDRMPQDRFSLSESASGAGKGKGKGDGFPYDYKDAEAVAPIIEQTGKADPQKVANIMASAQNMYALNPAFKTQPAVLMQIAASLEKGEAKPEAIYDSSTNTYFKGVKHGDGAVRIGGESDIDPDKFYGDKASTTGVRIATDRAWLPQYIGSLTDPKERASIESALSADTPAGKAARNEIIAAYNKARASGVEIPLFLRQKYSALQTADRLKVAPPEKAAAPSKSPAKAALTEDEKKLAESIGYNPDEPGLIDKAAGAGNRFLNAARGAISSANGDQFESAIRMAQRAPNMPGVKQKLFEMARGNPERMARIQEVFATQQTANK